MEILATFDMTETGVLHGNKYMMVSTYDLLTAGETDIYDGNDEVWIQIDDISNIEKKLEEIEYGLNKNQNAFIVLERHYDKFILRKEFLSKILVIDNNSDRDEEIKLFLSKYNENWLEEDILIKTKIEDGWYSYEENPTTNLENLPNTKKENKGAGCMNLEKIFGGKIGLVKDNNIKIGMNMKIAIKSSTGDYKTIDNGVLTNISDFAFETGIFIMPKLVGKVSVGDIIAKDNEFIYIISVNLEKKQFTGINYSTGQIATYTMQSHILLGQEYVRVLTSMFDGMSNSNMLPFLLMSGDSFSNIFENNSSLLMLSMFNQQNGTQNNNLLPLMLLSENKGNNMEMFMMMQMFGGLNLFPGTEVTINNKKEE